MEIIPDQSTDLYGQFNEQFRDIPVRQEFVDTLTEEQKTLRVMQRMISPPWTAELMVKNLKFAEAVAKEKPVYFLRCTKNDTAAETIRRQIEEDES